MVSTMTKLKTSATKMELSTTFRHSLYADNTGHHVHRVCIADLARLRGRQRDLDRLIERERLVDPEVLDDDLLDAGPVCRSGHHQLHGLHGLGLDLRRHETRTRDLDGNHLFLGVSTGGGFCQR